MTSDGLIESFSFVVATEMELCSAIDGEEVSRARFWMARRQEVGSR